MERIRAVLAAVLIALTWTTFAALLVGGLAQGARADAALPVLVLPEVVIEVPAR